MNEIHVNQSDVGLYSDESVSSDVLNESLAYDELLHMADAARAGLVSDEHDYDCPEDEDL